MKIKTLILLTFLGMLGIACSKKTVSTKQKASLPDDEIYFSKKDLAKEKAYYDKLYSSNNSSNGKLDDYQPMIQNPYAESAYNSQSRGVAPLDTTQQFRSPNTIINNNYYRGDSRFDNRNNDWRYNGYSGFGFNPWRPSLFYRYNRFTVGYNPWGFNSFYTWGNDPWGYNGFGYDPWGYNSFNGWGYSPFYSPYYNPYFFGYNDPFIFNLYRRPINVWNTGGGNNNNSGGSSGNNNNNINRPRGSGNGVGGSYINNNDVYSRPDIIKKETPAIEDNRNFDWNKDKNTIRNDINQQPSVSPTIDNRQNNNQQDINRNYNQQVSPSGDNRFNTTPNRNPVSPPSNNNFNSNPTPQRQISNPSNDRRGGSSPSNAPVNRPRR